MSPDKERETIRNWRRIEKRDEIEGGKNLEEGKEIRIPNRIFPSNRHCKIIRHYPQQSIAYYLWWLKMASTMNLFSAQKSTTNSQQVRPVVKCSRSLDGTYNKDSRPRGSRQGCCRGFCTRGPRGKRRRRRLMNVSVRERRLWHVTSVEKGEPHGKEIEK